MDLNKLPVHQKKQSKEQEIESRVKRRKKFSPRKWAAKWLTDSGGLPARVCLGDADSRPGVVCTKCGDQRFADVYGYPDPKTFVCDPCKDKVVQNSSKEVPMSDTTKDNGPGASLREESKDQP